MMSKYKNRRDLRIAFVERSSHHVSSQKSSSIFQPQPNLDILDKLQPAKRGHCAHV